MSSSEKSLQNVARECVLCGATPVSIEMRVGEYDLLHCSVCDLTFAYPFDVPHNLYDTAYKGEGAYASYALWQVAQIKAGRIRQGWAHRQFFGLVKPSGKLLDVGCGCGAFMMSAQKYGWMSVGVDISEEAVTLAKRELGLDVRIGIGDALNFDDAEFNAVTAWEVVEHLCSPMSFVKEVGRVLAPGGVFALSTPDWGSRWPRTTWRGNPASWPPIHVTFWSRASLHWLLTKSGFDNVQILRKPWAGFYELGSRSHCSMVPESLFRSILLRQGGGQLFATANVPVVNSCPT